MVKTQMFVLRSLGKAGSLVQLEKGVSFIETVGSTPTRVYLKRLDSTRVTWENGVPFPSARSKLCYKTVCDIWRNTFDRREMERTKMFQGKTPSSILAVGTLGVVKLVLHNLS